MTLRASSLEHYRELLEAAQAGGYRFAGFDGPPQAGDLFLRHDVDLSLDAAVRMAELEAAAEAWSTWFLMTRSVFYNLASQRGRARDRAAARARRTASRTTPSGRRRPRRALRTGRRLAQPGPGVHDGADRRRDRTSWRAPWFDPDHYRSDSNQHWRHGCPHDELRAASSSGCSC